MNTKNILITGASSGIGAGIALYLGANAHNIIVNYSGNAEAANDVVKQIEQSGGSAIAVKADVTKSNEVQALFDEAEKEYGPLDVLINNAGRAIRKPIADFSDEDIKAVIATNLYGAIFAMREAANRLKAGGRIINISMSFQGAPIPGYGVYFASKAGIEQLTAVLSKELGQKQITVNAIRPGPARTPLFLKGKSDEVVRQFEAQTALGRLTEPEDIAHVVDFLISDEADWITGQAFGVNGGYW